MDDVMEQSDANVTITLNGKTHSIRRGTHISDLLKELGLRERLVVVERNGAILDRSDYASALLAAGDVLEIVHFVGGG